MGEKAKRLRASRPVVEVGQLWRDWINGGQVTVDCVVVAVGELDVVLGVLSFDGSSFTVDHDVTPGATIVRNKNFVSSYWRLVA